jgi:uncharacterized protein (DUF2384 family)
MNNDSFHYGRNRTSSSIKYEDVLKKIMKIFNNERDKAFNFYLSPVSELNNRSPYEMIKIGKGRYVMRLLDRMDN